MTGLQVILPIFSLPLLLRALFLLPVQVGVKQPYLRFDLFNDQPAASHEIGPLMGEAWVPHPALLCSDSIRL